MEQLMDGAQLHDRATRGGNLTEVERVRLAQWYEDQDAVEAAMLAANRPVISSDSSTLEFQNVLTKVREITANIESLYQQNAALREEIAALQQRLTKQAA